jgi:hypothetical protein
MLRRETFPHESERPGPIKFLGGNMAVDEIEILYGRPVVRTPDDDLLALQEANTAAQVTALEIVQAMSDIRRRIVR